MTETRRYDFVAGPSPYEPPSVLKARKAAEYRASLEQIAWNTVGARREEILLSALVPASRAVDAALALEET